MNLQSIFTKLEITKSLPKQGQIVHEIPPDKFTLLCTKAVHDCELSLNLMYATDERRKAGTYFVYAVFFVPEDHLFLTLRTPISAENPRYNSLAATIMAAHWYERQIYDMFGIMPEGHPDFRRLVNHENIPAGTHPLRKDFAWNQLLPWAAEEYPLHQVAGKGVYEIPVGPIHAGIIEPGHFRFNVQGERILTLEGKLFFKHKGVEKLLEGKSATDALPIIERISGDAAVSHALAFVGAIENICNTNVPIRALQIRTILNEMERIAQHVFDIANMGGNGTGFSFMVMQGFRVYEKIRRLCQKVSGHRYLRGMIVPGGIANDISKEIIDLLVKELKAIQADFKEIVAVGESKDGMRERLDGTGVLSKDAAQAYGAVGIAARASGIKRDVRQDMPYAWYHKVNFSINTESVGDVRARYKLRVNELEESFKIIYSILNDLEKGAILEKVNYIIGSSLGWSESCRGEIIDYVQLDQTGHIDRCAVRDPSFCNWPLFGELGPGNIIPDFPLCNKSLNLSYSGCDL